MCRFVDFVELVALSGLYCLKISEDCKVCLFGKGVVFVELY